MSSKENPNAVPNPETPAASANSILGQEELIVLPPSYVVRILVDVVSVRLAVAAKGHANTAVGLDVSVGAEN
ncbi:hypothetical protein ACMFMG_002776 [Clarireedia jacksonii]